MAPPIRLSRFGRARPCSPPPRNRRSSFRFPAPATSISSTTSASRTITPSSVPSSRPAGDCAGLADRPVFLYFPFERILIVAVNRIHYNPFHELYRSFEDGLAGFGIARGGWIAGRLRGYGRPAGGRGAFRE